MQVVVPGLCGQQGGTAVPAMLDPDPAESWGALGLSPQCLRLWSWPPLPRDSCWVQRQGQPRGLGYIQCVLWGGLVCCSSWKWGLLKAGCPGTRCCASRSSCPYQLPSQSSRVRVSPACGTNKDTAARGPDSSQRQEYKRKVLSCWRTSGVSETGTVFQAFSCLCVNYPPDFTVKHNW